MEYDVLAFIGRFQPFHNGHFEVVKEALGRANRVLVVIGSHEQPRTARNPFTTQERIDMIIRCFPEAFKDGRIMFLPQHDHTYNMKKWQTSITSGITSIAYSPFTADPIKLGLIGHSKDHSSFYIKSFPDYGAVEVPNVDSIDATFIRNTLFEAGGVTSNLMPAPVTEFILAWKKTEHYSNIKREYAFIKEYKRQWATAPYPPVFYTADAVATQAANILLVTRDAMPGEGLLALPGGFIGQHERSFTAALRELTEETDIDIPDPVLINAHRGHKVYEDPYRSQRGRTITVAHRFDLPDRPFLPKVKGGDDARDAKWYPIGALNRSQMFEDHYDIIEDMLGL